MTIARRPTTLTSNGGHEPAAESTAGAHDRA
jgi:hypothetical protein